VVKVSFAKDRGYVRVSTEAKSVFADGILVSTEDAGSRFSSWEEMPLQSSPSPTIALSLSLHHSEL
jgi:hypothetical protein